MIEPHHYYLMSSSPLHDKLHELVGAYTFLINHQHNPENFPEDIQQAKETIQKLSTELNQHLGLDIYPAPDRDPGLETMFVHDLGQILPPT